MACLKPTSDQDDDTDSLSCSHYQHHSSVSDIVTSLTSVTNADIDKDFATSPFGYYSLMMDEATDVANKSVLMIYVQYISGKGDITCRFLDVAEMQATTADAIFEAATSVLSDKEMDTDDMVGLSTDGASVMTGVHKGVAARFKELNPMIISNHCMAHRLQLISEKAANEVKYFVKFIGVLNQFAKALKYSPKLCRALESGKHLANEKAKKIKQVFFTRWLSFEESVDALTDCVGEVISALCAYAGERC